MSEIIRFSNYHEDEYDFSDSYPQSDPVVREPVLFMRDIPGIEEGEEEMFYLYREGESYYDEYGAEVDMHGLIRCGQFN